MKRTQQEKNAARGRRREKEIARSLAKMANARCTATTKPRHLLAKAAEQMSTPFTSRSEARARRTMSCSFSTRCDGCMGDHTIISFTRCPMTTKPPKITRLPRNTASESDHKSNQIGPSIIEEIQAKTNCQESDR